MTTHPLAGVYVATITPLYPNYSIDLPAIAPVLDHLARRGCHGALLLGTTGEGPSFSFPERRDICRAALQIRQAHPGFHLLAGTGTPSLEETIANTRAVFDVGLDGVVVLPPYYYRKVTDDGLFAWFAEVIRRAVPADGLLFAYHIPAVSGVGLSLDLIARLHDAFPKQFAGLKDSSADLDFATQLGQRFGNDLLIFNGTDSLAQPALQAGAGGCITALANLFSPDLRAVWDAHQQGTTAPEAHARLQAARAISNRYPPASATLKALFSRLNRFPRWPVRPPLVPLARDVEERVLAELQTAGLLAEH